LGLWQLDARGPQEAVFVGLYVAGLNAARVLVIVPASLSGVLFSSAARAVGAGDDLSFQKYVRQTLRIGMILLAPACVLVAIDAQNVVRLLFGPEYSDAGLVLATACAAYAAMGLFDILAHALMAERRYRFTAATTCALLPLLFVMNGFLIPVAKGVGAAASLLAVFALGIVVSGATLRRRIGPLLQPRSVLRIAAACVLVGTLSAYVQADGYWLCVKFAVLGILYAGLLWVLRELSAADLAALVKAKRVSDGNAS
jgi:O-antigen/teichoic acid export membrane protein